MGWLNGWLPQLGVFAPVVALGWWVIQQKDKLLEEQMKRHDRLIEELLAERRLISAALAELTAYIKGTGA